MADIQQKLQEEKLLRAIRARRRFKAAVRSVIYNLSWLQDDEGGLSPTDIKQAVNRLTRGKKKTTEGLTIKEKSILRKNAQYRTNEEKKLLNKYIGGLKCFRRYPENVQLELVGVTYFDYYGPGRVLIKQNHEGHALYFLLSGEVIITKIMLDEVANVYQDVEVNRTPAGNMFGEISLLHNIPRTATVTTAAPCELLVLKRDDFDRVLKKSLLQQWDDIRVAMLKFQYFDHWDSVAIRECCMLAKMKSYRPNQIVYGDRRRKKGAPKCTYFVIEGSCSVVEHLFIEETTKRGIKSYKQYIPPEKEERKKTGISINWDETSIRERMSETSTASEVDVGSAGSCILPTRTVDGEYSIQNCVQNLVRKSVGDALLSGFTPNKMRQSGKTTSIDSRKSRAMSIMSYKNFLQEELRKSRDQDRLNDLPEGVKLRFMQICILGEKATFVENELMKNRRVIALTRVKVLVIPSYWLAQHNRGNVWCRVENFLYNRIPSREQVFKEFVKSQKWLEYRKKLRDEIISKRKFFNNTTIHDVPYSIRIMSNY